MFEHSFECGTMPRTHTHTYTFYKHARISRFRRYTPNSHRHGTGNEIRLINDAMIAETRIRFHRLIPYVTHVYYLLALLLWTSYIVASRFARLINPFHSPDYAATLSTTNSTNLLHLFDYDRLGSSPNFDYLIPLAESRRLLLLTPG